jgi:penicillin-binding protein 1A
LCHGGMRERSLASSLLLPPLVQPPPTPEPDPTPHAALDPDFVWPTPPIPPEPPPSRVRRITDRVRRWPWPVWVALAAGIILLAVPAVAWNRCGFQGCPDVQRLSSYRPGGAPVLLDRHGRTVGDLTPVDGQLVPLQSLPAWVPQAFIAIEDRRFREHGAVDVPRVVGALRANLRAGTMEQGFSTITMQLARNVFPERIPGRERTLPRKLLEIRVAREIEQDFSKDEILEMYLNHIYFGHGARGIEAAARHYFGTSAQKLTLPRAALLAALPKAPSHYDPRAHPREARQRRDLVLTLMEQQGRIGGAEAARARLEPLGLVPLARAQKTAAPFAAWYVEAVRSELEELLGPDLYDEKLRIRTTLDVEVQRAAEEELARQLRAVERGELGRFSGPAYTPAAEADDDQTPYLQGAVVALEVETGDVLAWVGGRDFNHSRFDRVQAARRQAGSSFKPFVYATALAAGRTLSQRVSDEPLQVPLDRRHVWEPKNFDESFEGSVTVRDALVRSKNVATVRLAQDVGFGQVADNAERAGLEGPVPRLPSMALGTVSVSPLQLAAAYTAFASLGEGSTPRLVLEVDRGNGEVLWRAGPPQRRRVWSPGVAYLVTDALREALVRGTGATVSQAGFRAPAAGKTGTTNDSTDAWFAGYTPRMVAVVWLGFDQQRPIMPRATGGRLAAPVWARIMKRVADQRPAPDWQRPSGVVEQSIDPASGLLLSAGCRPVEGSARRELFLLGTVPVSVCPDQGEALEPALAVEIEPPDFEEGQDTGVSPDQPPAEGDIGLRSYVPSTPPPRPTPTPTPTPPPQ